jgi:hypothetical protein
MLKKFSNATRSQVLMFLVCGMQCLLLQSMEITSRVRRQRVKELLQKNNQIVPQVISWNQDCSKCAWVNQKSSDDINTLEFTLAKLHKNADDIDIKTGTYDLYRWPALEDQKCPFFNNEGGVSYYIVGNIVRYFNRYVGDNSYVGYFDTVIECSMDDDGKIQAKKCCIGYNTSKLNFPVRNLLNFPKLLEAVLQSTEVYDFNGGGNIPAKMFVIHGVTIPEGYRDVQKYILSDDGYYSSYDDLPAELKEYIDERYTAQQQEKK